MMAELEKQLNDIKPVVVDCERLAGFKSEEDFIGTGVDFLIEVGSYVCVAACILPGDSKCWNRNQAIIGGNLVRLFKLISALLDQTCQHRRETTFIFARLAFETIVNIRYLIKHGSPALFHSYVLHSLRHEKKLYDRIQENIKARGGAELPIERRMIKSIERTAQKSEVPLTEASASRPKNWGDKNILQRAEEVGLSDAYLAAFGGGSHTVHGNWMDLLQYHLKDTERGFEPQLEWSRPARPQVLFAIALLSAETIGEYFRFIDGEAFTRLVEGRLTGLEGRIRLTDEAHERFLTARTGEKPGV